MTMNHHSESLDLPSVPAAEATSGSGNGRALPLCLLALWIANLAVFFIYFVKLGWTDLH